MALTLSGTAGVAASGPVTTAGLTTTTGTFGTEQSTVSGTFKDWTFPSNTKRIRFLFNSLSSNGSSIIQLQIGSGSIQTTGYSSNTMFLQTGPAIGSLSSTSGFAIAGAASVVVASGIAFIDNMGPSNNWVFSVSGSRSDSAAGIVGGGTAAISGPVDRIRLTTVNGTDVFDGGSVSITYETF